MGVVDREQAKVVIDVGLTIFIKQLKWKSHALTWGSMLIACFEVFKKCIQENYVFSSLKKSVGQKIGRRWNRGRGSGANVAHTQK